MGILIQPPAGMRYPAVFVTLGVLCLLFSGLAARVLTGEPSALIVAPLFAGLSPSLFATTWKYINVDTAATFFCALGVWYALAKLERTDLRSRALLPALICGAAAASKYNSALIMVPFLIAIGMRSVPSARSGAGGRSLG